MKRVFIVIFGCLLNLICRAQTEIPVTIVKTDGTQLDCMISTFKGKIISDFTFKIWINGEKEKIDRSEIKEILTDSSRYEIIEYEREERRSNLVITEKVKRMAELVIDGHVKLYAAYSVRSNSTYNHGSFISYSGEPYLITEHYLASDEVSMIRKSGFKKTIKEYFPKCDELNNRVISKDLDYKDVKIVVKIGNNCN